MEFHMSCISTALACIFAERLLKSLHLSGCFYTCNNLKVTVQILIKFGIMTF
jgi:hypothetical protein